MCDLDSVHGVIPAMISCFDDEGRFDQQAQRRLTRFLLSKNIGGLYLTGSTGEAFLMEESARKAVVETVMDEVGDKVPVIVHVGDIGTAKTIDYAKHAQAMGASAISSVPPFYWKFSSDEILGYYSDVSSAVSLPMIVYNIALAGIVDFGTIKQLSGLEHVKGIKYTATTHHEILRIKDEIGDDFKVYSGADEMAMGGLAFGADGIIGSFYNVIPELFITIVSAIERNDIPAAREAQKKANAIIYYVLANHFFDTLKAMLNWAGLGSGTVLKPFYRLSADDEIKIKAGLKDIIRKYDITGCEVLDRIMERN